MQFSSHNIDGIIRHLDSLFWREARKHAEEIDVEIYEHRGSEVGVLMLKTDVLRANVSRGAFHRCSNQGATMAGVSD